MTNKIGLLRTAETEARYEADLKAGKTRDLMDVPAIMDFKYFKVIKNHYPHDKIAKVHHLLIPKRRFQHWHQMKRRERKEFKMIDEVLSRHYHCIKRNYPALISVPELVHWHLYVLKEEI